MWWLLPIQIVSGTHRQLLCPRWRYNTKRDLITVHCFSVPLICMLEEVCWDSHFTAIAPCIALGNSLWLAFSIHQNRGLGAADTTAITHGTYGFCGPLRIGLLHLLFLFLFFFFLFFSLVLSFCLLSNVPRKYGSHHLYVVVNWEINNWEGF